MGELSDRDLTRVLDRAAIGSDVDPSRRNQIRGEVLREFDRSAIAARPPDAPTMVVTSITSSPRGSRRTPWVLSAAAAVVIMVVVGGLVFAGNRSSDDQPVADRSPSLPADSVLPAPDSVSVASVLPAIDELRTGDPIPPGRYETTIAGGLSFETPDGVVLVDHTVDRLTIGLADTDGFVSIVPVDDVSILDEAIARAEIDGLLRVERSVGRAGGEAIERLDLTLTAAGIDRYGCAVGGLCSLLDAIEPGLTPLALQAGAENFTTLLTLDNEVSVAIVEQFAAFGSPTTSVANSIIETIERTESD